MPKATDPRDLKYYQTLVLYVVVSEDREASLKMKTKEADKIHSPFLVLVNELEFVGNVVWIRW